MGSAVALPLPLPSRVEPHPGFDLTQASPPQTPRTPSGSTTPANSNTFGPPPHTKSQKNALSVSDHSETQSLLLMREDIGSLQDKIIPLSTGNLEVCRQCINNRGINGAESG